jgi:hypothetical protein
MQEIILTTGERTLVSDEDFEYLIQWEWCPNYHKNITYAMRSDYSTGSRKAIIIHRVIATRMGLDITDKEIDHKDRDGLNNQRSNIRTCNKSQNQQNASKRVDNCSGYRGVRFDRRSNRWAAQIRFQTHAHHLGYFDNEEKAALAYNAAAIRFFGEFAVLNEI